MRKFTLLNPNNLRHIQQTRAKPEGLLYKHCHNSLTDSVCLCPFVTKALKRRQPQTVRNDTFSPKIDKVAQVQGLLNQQGYQNCIIGSKVMAILQKGLIFLIGQLASERLVSRPTRFTRGCSINTVVIIGATLSSFMHD